MAFQSVWYLSELPGDIIDIVERDLIAKYDPSMVESRLHEGAVNKEKRDSHNAWVTSDDWVTSFVWHYVNKANNYNFMYDITNLDSETVQYTRYGPGQYYGWHTDYSLSTAHASFTNGQRHDSELLARDYMAKNTEQVRKLSVVIQLSDPDEYEGGNLQLLDESDKSYIAPRKKGTVIVFDSRTRHRVQKIRSGTRRSIVAWIMGPRWK
jgi:predicted 2-oxoglutarate/Fe(II)-dependent dioxygenase YbiX